MHPLGLKITKLFGGGGPHTYPQLGTACQGWQQSRHFWVLATFPLVPAIQKLNKIPALSQAGGFSWILFCGHPNN